MVKNASKSNKAEEKTTKAETKVTDYNMSPEFVKANIGKVRGFTKLSEVTTFIEKNKIDLGFDYDSLKFNALKDTLVDTMEFVVESVAFEKTESKKSSDKKVPAKKVEKEEEPEEEPEAEEGEEVDFDEMDLDEVKTFAVENELMTKKEIQKLIGDIDKKSKAKRVLVTKLEELIENDVEEGEGDEGDDEEIDFDEMDKDELIAYIKENEIATAKQIKKAIDGLKDSKAKKVLIEMIEEANEEAEEEPEEKPAKKKSAKEEKAPAKSKAKKINFKTADPDSFEYEDLTLEQLIEFNDEYDYLTKKEIKEITKGKDEDEARDELIAKYHEIEDEPDFDEMDNDELIEYIIENEMATKKSIAKKTADLTDKKVRKVLMSIIEENEE